MASQPISSSAANNSSITTTCVDQLADDFDSTNIQDGCSYRMTIYVSPTTGNDVTGDGSKAAPFASLHHALSFAISSESSSDNNQLAVPKDVKFLLEKDVQEGEEGEKGYFDAPKSALKKALNYLEILEKKAKKTALKEVIQQSPTHIQTQVELIELKEDPSLPPARRIRIRESLEARKASIPRVLLYGWVHRMRAQGKNMVFLTLRDGTGFLQCLLSNEQCHSLEIPRLTVESTVALYGRLVEVPEGKSAPGGHELVVDYWKLVHAAPSGIDAFETRLNKEANPDVLFDLRHLVLRGETASALMKLRSIFLQAFRSHYIDNGYCELTTPCLTQTECEGGSTLFKLDYYGEPAYLTQSSQLYLETAIPSLGDVFCIQMSFRAEASRTRRHLSEFTHIEAEMPFITYEELLERIESLVCNVLERVFSNTEAASLISELNPSLSIPKRPFRRMQYDEAIEWLRVHNVRKDDGTLYEFGEDIPEKPERHMVDTIGEPIFLCRFPADMKAFYMFKDPTNPTLTHSTDLLMPGVGEIVGGSMRIWDFEELLRGYAREGIDPKHYYWYTDQRKYGSCPHGGYGLGFERFLAWALGREHVREVCFYPRYMKRCTP